GGSRPWQSQHGRPAAGLEALRSLPWPGRKGSPQGRQRDTAFSQACARCRLPFAYRSDALPLRTTSRIWLGAITDADDMDDRFAAGDFLLDHLANAAVIRRKIRLLDRHAVHRQERFFYEFSHRAQVLGRGGNEHTVVPSDGTARGRRMV